jgi:hypothetical protein
VPLCFAVLRFASLCCAALRCGRIVLRGTTGVRRYVLNSLALQGGHAVAVIGYGSTCTATANGTGCTEYAFAPPASSPRQP